MENNKVRQFVGLLLNGGTVENAVKTSGVGNMKLHDICVAISGMNMPIHLKVLLLMQKRQFRQLRIWIMG